MLAGDADAIGALVAAGLGDGVGCALAKGAGEAIATAVEVWAGARAGAWLGRGLSGDAIGTVNTSVRRAAWIP